MQETESGYRARSKARKSAVQAIYQGLLNSTDVDAVIEQFEEHGAFRAGDREYFEWLVNGAVDRESELAASLSPYLTRSFDDVDPVEQSVLLVAAWELDQASDVPARVVIDEAVGLARIFGGEGSHGLVNAALDRLARVLRTDEF